MLSGCCGSQARWLSTPFEMGSVCACCVSLLERRLSRSPSPHLPFPLTPLPSHPLIPLSSPVSTLYSPLHSLCTSPLPSPSASPPLPKTLLSPLPLISTLPSLLPASRSCRLPPSPRTACALYPARSLVSSQVRWTHIRCYSPTPATFSSSAPQVAASTSSLSTGCTSGRGRPKTPA